MAEPMTPVPIHPIRALSDMSILLALCVRPGNGAVASLPGRERYENRQVGTAGPSVVTRE